jgi:cellobiose-specific phosphotransferase system component IIA
MKKLVTLSTIAATLMLGAVSLQAEEHKAPESKEAKAVKVEKRLKHTDAHGDTYYSNSHVKLKPGLSKEIHKHSGELKGAPKEIAEGLQKTIKAINEIENNKVDEAKKLLKEAGDAFAKALKEKPDLKLVPVENEIMLYRFGAQPETIEARVKLAKQLLDDYQTQAARDILMPMKDEIDITTVFIPMDLYPVATKKALEALEKGKKDEAIEILAGGLNTLVGTRIIVPASLLAAQELTEVASKLDKEKKDDAIKILEQAKQELEKARLLGYVSKHAAEYKALSESIDKVEKEIKGENKVEKLYEELKKSFESLLNKVRSDKIQLGSGGEKAEKKADEAEKKEAPKADEKKEEAKSDK